MTKKRFVKLLMAQGFTRNGAKEYAMRLSNARRPYARAYSALMTLTRASSAVDGALRKAAEALAAWATEFNQAFVKRLDAKMRDYLTGGNK